MGSVLITPVFGTGITEKPKIQTLPTATTIETGEIVEGNDEINNENEITANGGSHSNNDKQHTDESMMDGLRPATNNFRTPFPYTSFGRAEAIAVAQNYTIDTSRAKTNKHVVSICAAALGLHEYPEGRDDGDACDIYWHNIVYHDMRSVVKSPHAKINKFPGMTDLSKKISLTRAISSMRLLFPDEYHFYPSSWFIPAQLGAFIEHCNYRPPTPFLRNDTWYIVKPDDGAQGTGIYLIQRPEQIREPEARQLIQEYIAEPYLMSDNLKFDFRVYAVIKSINPLSIYVAREGMARFCTEKYAKPTSTNFENLYSHLTNYSLNKENNAYIHSLSLRDQMRGSKRLLSTVFYQMESRGVKTRQLWHDIKLIIVKTVIAMLPEIILNYEHYFHDSPGPQCFQIMGFDILVTKNLQPVLLEVNSAPSLTIEHYVANLYDGDDEKENVEPLRSIVDEVIKIPLVRDTILLVLNLIDDVYSTQRTIRQHNLSFNLYTDANRTGTNLQIPQNIEFSSSSSRTGNNSPHREMNDDMGEIKARRKCHLIEIFPCRYGQTSGHLLFLDKAVYLFMQFVNLRQTTVMTISGARTFLRKCNLLDMISMEELEMKYIEIYRYFTVGEYVPYVSGLSFHGFLYLLYYIAQVKFPIFECLLEQMQQLLAFCDTSLRHYGVRSARLRHAQIDRENSRNVEIYLLPERRLANKRISRTETRLKATESLKFRPRYGRSLPRTLNGMIASKQTIPVNYNENHSNNKKDELILPRIQQPFRF